MTVRATRVRRLRIRKAIRRTTFAVAMVTVGTLYIAIQKNVTLIVEGRPQVVRTTASSIEQLLGSRGISLEPGMTVEPPPGTAITDGMTVLVDLDGYVGAGAVDEGVWVVDGTSDPFAKAASLRGASAGGVGSSRAVSVGVVVRGKDHGVLTNAVTVRELLSAMGIQPDDDDHVSPPPSSILVAGTVVRYVQVEVLTKKVRRWIQYPTHLEYTTDLSPGVTKVAADGRRGVLLRTYRVRVVDGRVARRTLVSKYVMRAPVAEEKLVGREPAEAADAGHEVGEASWYYAPSDGLTAAHPWLPFGTVVKVTNLENGKSVTVVINDRGPFGGRIIDLNEEAFAQIASLGQGVAQVRLSW